MNTELFEQFRNTFLEEIKKKKTWSNYDVGILWCKTLKHYLDIQNKNK